MIVAHVFLFPNHAAICPLTCPLVQSLPPPPNQEPVLFSTTIRENILYGASSPGAVTEERLRSAIEQANAAEFIDRSVGGRGGVSGFRGGEGPRLWKFSGSIAE